MTAVPASITAKNVAHRTTDTQWWAGDGGRGGGDGEGGLGGPCVGPLAVSSAATCSSLSCGSSGCALRRCVSSWCSSAAAVARSATSCLLAAATFLAAASCSLSHFAQCFRSSRLSAACRRCSLAVTMPGSTPCRRLWQLLDGIGSHTPGINWQSGGGCHRRRCRRRRRTLMRRSVTSSHMRTDAAVLDPAAVVGGAAGLTPSVVFWKIAVGTDLCAAHTAAAVPGAGTPASLEDRSGRGRPDGAVH